MSQVETLWDTGAWVSLIDADAVEEFVGKGARVNKLEKPVRLKGLGGSIEAYESVQILISLQDNKQRELECFAMRDMPFTVIIGQPFMKEHRISCLITEQGLELRDHSIKGGPVIHRESLHPFAAVMHVQTGTEQNATQKAKAESPELVECVGQGDEGAHVDAEGGAAQHTA